MQIKHEYFTLKNGLKVLLVPSDTVNSVQISAYILTGAAIETKVNAGISHLIEHIAISENEKWQNSEEFEEEKEIRGASDNAYTSKERIKYYVNVPYLEIDFAFEMIYQTLFKATISEEILEKQRNIILDEISKEDDDVAWQNANFIWDALSQNRTGYSQKISGSAENVKKFSRNQVLEHYKFTHQPKNILLTVAGNFTKENIENWLKKFEAENRAIQNIVTDTNVPELPIDKLKQKATESRNYSKTDLIYTTLIADMPKSKDLERKEEMALRFILTILCGPISSRLVRRLRERENLLYYIDLGINNYKHFSTVRISWEIPPENEKKVMDIVMEEIHNLFDKGITDVELDRYKKYITNRSLIRFDEIYEIAELIENQILNGIEIEPDIKALNRVIESFDLDYVNSIVKKYKYLMENVNVLRFGKV